MAGVTIFATGVIHLVVTPSLYRWFGAYVGHWLHVIGPPFLLNHFIVGILLLALGIITCIAASGVAISDRRAWWTALVSAVSVASLPVLLVVLMRGGMYDAKPFVAAEILVTLSAIAMLGAVMIASPYKLRTPHPG